MAINYISITPLMGQVTAVPLGSLCMSSLCFVLVLFVFSFQDQLNFLDSVSPPASLPLFIPLIKPPFTNTSNLVSCIYLLFLNVKNRGFIILNCQKFQERIWTASCDLQTPVLLWQWPSRRWVVHCVKIMLFIPLASKPEADAVPWY